MEALEMKRNESCRALTVLGSLVLLGCGVGAVTSAIAGGEPPRLPTHFAGLLNDYTPPAPGIKGGPYEMHGKWALDLNEERHTAIFSAEMTMETADFANTATTGDPTKLGPHTHHISVTDGVLHDGPTDWVQMCPTFSPPVVGGFVVTGTASVTGNGGNPPFGNPSSVTICVLGGAATNVTGAAYVTFANFTLAFGSGSHASTHFGTQAINGVVSRCNGPWGHPSRECAVEVE
jgi:hypothetical protein